MGLLLQQVTYVCQMAYFDEKIKQKNTWLGLEKESEKLAASLLLPEESFLVPNTRRSCLWVISEHSDKKKLCGARLRIRIRIIFGKLDLNTR